MRQSPVPERIKRFAGYLPRTNVGMIELACGTRSMGDQICGESRRLACGQHVRLPCFPDLDLLVSGLI
jgi:hypothetical protein